MAASGPALPLRRWSLGFLTVAKNADNWLERSLKSHSSDAGTRRKWPPTRVVLLANFAHCLGLDGVMAPDAVSFHKQSLGVLKMNQVDKSFSLHGAPPKTPKSKASTNSLGKPPGAFHSEIFRFHLTSSVSRPATSPATIHGRSLSMISSRRTERKLDV